MTEENPTRRKTRGKRQNYALLEDADEELLKQLDDDEELDEFENECKDHNYFNPLTSESSILSPAHTEQGNSNFSMSLTNKEDSSEENTGPKPRIFKEWTYTGIQENKISKLTFFQKTKAKRGQKRKYEEWTYKGSQHGKTVNDVVVKEKLLSSMQLGIDRNLPVEQVIGATIELGFPAYLVTWVGSDESDLLPAETCKRKYPQPLIRFFEKHLDFSKSKSDI